MSVPLFQRRKTDPEENRFVKRIQDQVLNNGLAADQ
jgi:hypothetical protein